MKIIATLHTKKFLTNSHEVKTSRWKSTHPLNLWHPLIYQHLSFYASSKHCTLHHIRIHTYTNPYDFHFLSFRRQFVCLFAKNQRFPKRKLPFIHSQTADTHTHTYMYTLRFAYSMHSQTENRNKGVCVLSSNHARFTNTPPPATPQQK